MRSSWRSRFAAALLTGLVLFDHAGRTLGYVSCPHHDAAPTAPIARESHPAAHQHGPASQHERHGTTPCNCTTSCGAVCCSVLAAAPLTLVLALSPHVPIVVRYEVVIHRRTLRSHFLPFATAPPQLS